MLIPLLVTVVFSVGTARAVAADPYVVYTANNEVDGAVILRSVPATGSTVEISRNGRLGSLFQHPYDLAVEADGSLLVADMGVRNQKDGAIIRVDPFTGRQSVVSSGGLFYDPSGIAIGPGGILYVLDNLAGTNSGAVIRVNPGTGQQQLISSDLNPPGLFDLPFGIAVDPDGSVVVVNRALAGPLPLQCLLPTGSVIRINPANGSQTLISQLGRLSRPLGLAIDADRSMLVANECGSPAGVGVVRVNPTTGAQSDVTTNNDEDLLRTPERVARNPAGELLVTDYSLGADGDGGIVKVNPATGAQSVVSTDNLFNHPLGIAVVANLAPAVALAVKPRMVAAGRRVTLDASRSRDPEGLRLVYEWDLDGNGTFEAGSGTTPRAMPRFAVDGRRVVRVRVNDPHGGRAVATRTLDVDGSRPVLTDLRAASRVLGVPSGRGQGAAATRLRFRLSEAATVTVALNRARPGRRSKGRACRPLAKRGRRCTVWSRARTIRRSAGAGQNGILLRARGLRPGRYRVVLTATDRVGNRSPRRTLELRVVRLR
jgi:DNA-binding beta-propeller fold protein YncE